MVEECWNCEVNFEVSDNLGIYEFEAYLSFRPL